MGLFDWLLGKDPTEDWPNTPAAPLEYDFDRHALCGVKIGSRAEDFRKLGRAEDTAKARKGTLYYYSRGFYVSLERGHAMDFVLFWSDDWSDRSNGPKPFRGKCRVGGREVRLDEDTTEQELVGWLGEPKHREQDDESVLLRFERPGPITYEFDLTEGGRLREMIVIAEESAKPGGGQVR
jgi:hypothetical protein